MTTTTSLQPSRRRRVVRAATGFGAAAAMLASAAVATAQPISPSLPSEHTTAAISATSHRPDSTIHVSGHSMRAGSQLTISGDAPRNARTGTYVDLQSFAFDTKHKVQGIPAIRAQVSAQGTYRATTVLRQGLKPTTYAIAVNFQGKLVSSPAWITIHPGPDSTVQIGRPQVSPGATIRVSGDAPTYAPTGKTVTLSSAAFVRPVTAQVSAQGTYRVTGAIRHTVKAGNYKVTGSYRGHGFSTSATITVR
jgi:hypothetical protein